jgi:ribosomal protein L29
MKKLSKPHLLKMTKKNLARVLTIIREKEIKNA